MLRRLWDNLGTLGLALFLAVLVWVFSVNEENPVVERTLEQAVPVELVGRPADMLVTSPVISRTTVTLRAPLLVWDRLGPQSVRVVANLEGVEPGEATRVPLEATVNDPSARLVRLQPDSILVELEQLAERVVPIRLEQSGTPALGYSADPPVVATTAVTLDGPAPAVESVSEVVARFSVEGQRRDFNGLVTLVPVDTLGNEVRGVTLSPATLQVTVPIVQKQGFREVAVKVFYTGQVASGYQVTGVTVSPVIITLSSGDPRLVEQMPGFVETQPLDISGASDDIVRRLPLQLPPGVNVEGDQTVVVQVSIAAIEYSVRIARRVEVRGLAPGLAATLSPETVDVLILGPLTVLDRLTLSDVRVALDLAGRAEGVYRLVPELVLVDDRLRAESIFPSQIEVVIDIATPTPTLTPSEPGEAGQAGAAVSATPTPTPTPSPSTTPRRPVATPVP